MKTRPALPQSWTLPPLWDDAMVLSRPGRTWIVLGLAFLVLALFHSDGLAAWASRLPAEGWGERVHQAALWWDDQMAALHLNRLIQWLRDAFSWFHDR